MCILFHLFKHNLNKNFYYSMKNILTDLKRLKIKNSLNHLSYLNLLLLKFFLVAILSVILFYCFSALIDTFIFLFSTLFGIFFKTENHLCECK